MKLQAVLAERGEPVKARFDIHRAEQDTDGKRKMVKRESSKPNKPALIELNPGFYFVTATYGKAERSFEMAVKADELIEETLVIPAGHLRLAAALTEDGETVKARFDVFHAKQYLEGRRKMVGRKNSQPGKPALFKLAEGTYFVEAVYGDAKDGFEVEVKPGEQTDAPIIVPLAE